MKQKTRFKNIYRYRPQKSHIGRSLFHSSTNLRVRQLWHINVFPTAVYDQKQAEKWPQVRKTFKD